MHVATCLLAFVSSTFAYRVLSPNTQNGWTNQGDQVLTWERVSSDKSTFSIVLDNQQIDGFTRKLLASEVDGTKGQASLSPPSGGWPTGSDFRVNLIASADEFDSIYAQSPNFNIKKVAASSSAKGSGYNPISKYNPVPEYSPQPGYDSSQDTLTGPRPTVLPKVVSTTPHATTQSAISPVDDSFKSISNSATPNTCFSSGLLGLSILLAFALV